MNLKYRRQATPELLRLVRRDSVILLLFWGIFAGLTIEHVIPLRTFAIWLAVLSIISFVNTLRTLGAHEYESDGQPLDRMGQLLDSIDTPGAFWTELWAPVGLRYHALHHYFPGIPYHNLRRAYRRIAGPLARRRGLQTDEQPQPSAFASSTLSEGVWMTRPDAFRRH